MINLKTLKKIRLFGMLPEDTLREIAAVLAEKHYQKTEFIIHRNEPGNCMYFLLSGRVKVRIPDKPDSLLEEGTFFGEMALISGAPRAADVLADSDVRLLSLSKQQFETELAARPVFSRLLTQVFAERLGSPTDELSEKRLGKYRIHREIGRGAMGVIYYGSHLSLEMPVAVKMLSHRFVFDTGSLRKFLNEAKIIASLNHENIRPVIDIEQAYGTYFIIMEYIEGVSLDNLLPVCRELPFDVLREIIYRTADGLSHAHSRGVVHRDIKPGNILITTRGEIKLTDFGIAYADNENLKKVESLSLGTPYYAAPEQIRGEEVDHRADIYAFGVMCYRLLTGKMPFEGSDPLTVFARHLNDEYPPPRELVPGLPQDLVTLIGCCLEKEKHKRLNSLANLRELCQVWAFGESYRDTMQQAILELGIADNVDAPARQLMHKVQSMLKQEGTGVTKAAAQPAKPVVTAGAGGITAADEIFVMQPEQQPAEDLFEFEIGGPGACVETIPGGGNLQAAHRFTREKQRQEGFLLQHLSSRLKQIPAGSTLLKLLTVIFDKILGEECFAILQADAAGNLPADGYAYRSRNYQLSADTESRLIRRAAGRPETLFEEQAAGRRLMIPVRPGGEQAGLIILCKAEYPGSYSGDEFFHNLVQVLMAVPA